MTRGWLSYLRPANPILEHFGYKIVAATIGHWYVERGEIKRTVSQYGWRIAKPGQWEGLSDNATAFDRFRHSVKQSAM